MTWVEDWSVKLGESERVEIGIELVRLSFIESGIATAGMMKSSG